MELPKHIEAELERLIDRGMPVEKIAFMLRLDKKVVEEAVASRRGQAAAVQHAS